MISHNHNFIFVHIPKCAGSAIEKMLFPFASDSCGVQWARNTKNYRNRELFNTMKEYGNYFTFTFSRNPFDRFVSLWTFFGFESAGISLSEFAEQASSFLQQCPGDIYRKVPFNETRLKFEHKTKVDYLDQLAYPFKDSGNIGYHLLPQNYFYREEIDFIGKYETLQADFDIVCERIGIPGQKLPLVNQSSHKHYSTYYYDDLTQFVGSIYSQDFRRFGYAR